MPPNNEIAEAIRELIADLHQRHSENVTRHEVTDRKVDEAIRRIDDLHDAFPGGDWDGHRRYHEAVIKKLEARAKLFEELRSHLLKNGLWVGLGFVAWALW